MERLFAVYVGGLVEGCHVELHDLRFVIAAEIEDAFDDLRAQWWGTPESLHLDAWGVIEHTDGHRVEIVANGAPADGPALYHVNLGGYDPAQFTELHENLFVVADDPRAAKRRALDRIAHWRSPHKDAVNEIENIVDVAAAVGRRLRLAPEAGVRPFQFEARYVRIGRRA